MREHFVKTQNVLRLLGALGELERGSAVVPKLALVHGHQGFGKTEACKWFAVQHGYLYLRAEEVWTQSRMLAAMAEALNLGSSGAWRNYNTLKGVLRERREMVLLDEADYIIRDARKLNVVRDLHDATGTPFVLVGMAGAREAVARRSPQFWSRVSQEVEFQALITEDIQVIGAELADLQLSAELAREIRRRTGGNFRNVVVLLAGLETLIKTNAPKAGEKAVSLKLVEAAAAKLRAVG